MRKILLFVVLLLMVSLPVQAQDGYRLREPSAAEYIARITEIAATQHSPMDCNTRTLYLNITNELFRRFPDLNTVDFANILAAYDAMGIGMDGTFWGRSQWVEAMIAAWLAQNQPDPSSESVITAPLSVFSGGL
ncbi:MAG: hypothetical protein K8I60_11305 [Anaerolineae bacterium]|nr:hypothetical protein [Anaerolineae bacterium]